MANLSDKTRMEQVESYLLEFKGEWVDGTELATETVGGSEGLKRLRELRATGKYLIETRKHPDPRRDIFQYRLTIPPAKGEPGYVDPKRTPIPVDESGRYTALPLRLAFGEAMICPRCHSQTKRLAKGSQILPLFRDPDDGKEFCRGCNGYGIVPATPVAPR